MTSISEPRLTTAVSESDAEKSNVEMQNRSANYRPGGMKIQISHRTFVGDL